MKKKFMLCVPVLALGLLTSGCGNTKVLECTMSEDNDGMEMSQVVKATYKKDALSKVDMTMKITVDEEYSEYMDLFASSLTSEFDELEDQKGVTMNTETKDNTLTFSLVADLNSMSDEAKEELDMEEDAGTYDEAKKYFEEEGYTCK